MPYYCGTIIVYVDQHGDEDTFQLMDGQQRWTSYTALMGAIFHLLDNGNDGSNWDEIKSDIATRFLKTLTIKIGYKAPEVLITKY